MEKIELSAAATILLIVFLAFSANFATQQMHDTFSFLCQDQKVKVDSNIYHLDRLNSSLKSEYFEKLFTSEDYKRENDPILEIRPLNNEVFPAILDIIHGKEVHDVLDKDNYIPLLVEMNHFGMQIDLETYSNFIDRNLESYAPQEAKIFELYSFIRQNSEFNYLLDSIFKHLSKKLDVIQHHEIFSSDFPIDHLFQIIKKFNHPDEKTRYHIVQMCSRWLSHDMEKRLPHMAKLVRKAKRLYQISEEMETDFRKCLPSCDLDEEARQKMISTCFFASLANGGRLHPTTPTPDEEYNYDSCYPEKELKEDTNDKSDTETVEYDRFVNIREYSVKLNELRENGDLCDITVRVGSNTYKLHRRILESKSGYFMDIFRSEYSEAIAQGDGTPTTCPSFDNEYLLSDEIDSSGFENVINSVYEHENVNQVLAKYEYKWNKIANFLKIVHALRIDQLLENCIEILTNEHQKVSSQDVKQILNFVHGKTKYEDLYVIHLSKHLADNWPNIYNMTQFCSISWTVLRKMLKSSHLRFDDRHKILDICSKWTSYDSKNRYPFLPEIAYCINPHCVVNNEEFTTHGAAHLNESEQFIRDKLWKILSSLSYTISSVNTTKNISTKSEEIPVFIAMKKPETPVILNADLDVIKSIKFSEYPHPLYWVTPKWRLRATATLIKNNLFILVDSFDDPFIFQVYNFMLGKCFGLRFDLRRGGNMINYDDNFLLNCNNEIYSCSTYGHVAKYSMQLNTWTILSEDKYQKGVCYTSDGKILYRIYQSQKHFEYILEEYDFKKKLWNHVSSYVLPVITNPFSWEWPKQLIMVNDRDFVLRTDSNIIIFNRDHVCKEWHWNYHIIPEELRKYSPVFAPYGDRVLLLNGDKSYYYYHLNGTFEFKNNFSKNSYYEYDYGIVAIDRHLVVNTKESD